MAVEADRSAQSAPVTLAGIRMHLMAREAGDVALATYYDIAHIRVDVSVTGIELWIICRREIHFEILKEIVSGNEVVGVGKPC